MFASNRVIPVLVLALLAPCAPAFSAGITLANGIRVFDLPSEAGSFEILAGYQAGGRTALDFAIGAYLSSSASARALALAVYSVGGQTEFFNEIDRTGFHLRIPNWAIPTVIESIAAYFREIPGAVDPVEESLSQESQVRWMPCLRFLFKWMEALTLKRGRSACRRERIFLFPAPIY